MSAHKLLQGWGDALFLPTPVGSSGAKDDGSQVALQPRDLSLNKSQRAPPPASDQL